MTDEREDAQGAYDWIDDPFDEQKAAEERAHAGMGGGTKAFVGCGLALAVAACVGGAVIAIVFAAL